ncbi:hypothetical protein [Janthinobacterium sp. HLX7-2]|uniref:hypothetical protein n=1 Tax=Janthinobacterium sp. HLX7-2 TaxID=1259331 RepID=UPI003F26729C
MPSLPTRYCAIACLQLLLLSGCTTARTDLAQVRALAAGEKALPAFGELALRHRDSYARLRPYLSPPQDASEKVLDQQRRAMHADVALIQRGMSLYLQALGRLAGKDRFALDSEINAAGSAIRAWPDSGIVDRDVMAYTVVLRLLARLQGEADQQAQLAQVLREGDDAVQTLLSTLASLLRLYDKAGDNERDIVLGLLEMDLAFTDTPQLRLLTVLAKTVQQSKIEEYQLYGLRHTLARQQLAALAREHARLATAATPTTTTEARWMDHQAANAVKQP